jgi:hypothetical protein
MQIVFAALHFPRDRRFVTLAGGSIETAVSGACAVGYGSCRQPAVTLLTRWSHLLFGNRLAIDGGGWLGTFGMVELEDGVGLALIGVGHDSVLLVFTTAHGASIRTGMPRLEASSLFVEAFFPRTSPGHLVWDGLPPFGLPGVSWWPRKGLRSFSGDFESFRPRDRFSLMTRQRVPHAPRPSFPFRLAWHSLGRKPCARRLRPFCFARSGAPCGFRLPRQHCKSLATPARCNLAGPPEKARPQAWEQPPLALRVPKPNGQKRSN